MMTAKPLRVYRRRARVTDCDLLEADARADDRQEVAAIAGISVGAGARFALRSSEAAWSIFANRRLVLIYGVTGDNPLAGGRLVWMLGTTMVDSHVREFIRRSRAETSRLVGIYGSLENMVDARSLRTIRWLRFLGFTIYAPEPYGLAGLPFHRFRIEPPCASPELA